jgi:hypothetical protein
VGSARIAAICTTALAQPSMRRTDLGGGMLSWIHGDEAVDLPV